MKPIIGILLLVTGAPARLPAQAPQAPAAPTRADILRGEYGPYRANNDLLFYHLDVRVDPEKKLISGKNTIRFRMLKDGTRIQLDLHEALKSTRFCSAIPPLQVRARFRRGVRGLSARRSRAGRVYSIDFYYSGNPLETGRFGGITFRKDPSGHPWINTACEGIGASLWWPNKDQWRDEVETMEISVAIPNGLVDVSNGKFVGKTDLGDGYTRWDWLVHYPINNYDVSLNIGNYEHFADRLGDLPLDFYALPEDLDKAKKQFAQAKGMLEAFQHYFGEYPFKKDGYKLIEVPYSGMEHQSAVTYGNHFANGYLERDWTGVGISPRFDFIIIHESAHEWFGNSITAADVSDMWIHEGWATYLECLYVEYMCGHDDALKYLNGYKSKVRNQQPIITQRGVNRYAAAGPVLQGRAVPQHAAQRGERRHALVGAAPRFLPALQVSEHHDRGRGGVLQPEDRDEPDAGLRSVSAPCRPAGAGTEVRRGRGHGLLPLEGRRAGFAMPVRVGAKDHWQIDSAHGRMARR